MEEASETAMDIDGDGASGNITTDKSIQLNQQPKKVNLMDLPTEVLEKIVSHLDDYDKQLVTASHVCKLFASIVETVFAQKYCNLYYHISAYWSEIKIPFHKVILTKYGGKIRNIFVQSLDETFLNFIEQNCPNLERVILCDAEKMLNSKGLKEICLQRVRTFNREILTEIINNNEQLETLDIREIDADIMDILDGRLHVLTKLVYRRTYTNFTADLPKIRLKSLETLRLNLRDTKDFVRFLQAMNCNEIREIHLEKFGDFDDDIINEICSFNTLVSLQLSAFSTTDDQIRQLAQHLPHLTSLNIQLKNSKMNTKNSILTLLSMFPKLTSLTIKFNDKNFDRFLDCLKKSMYDFHASIAKANAQILITNDMNKVIVSNDYIFLYKYEHLFEIHWMANLNGKMVRELMAVESQIQSELKFINNCADSILDVSTLMHPMNEYITSLNIESNGPITVNANASRLAGFFPHLEILKIRLTQHDAMDLLRNLDEKWCKNIKKLWLNTANHQNPEQGDMTSILSKFINLESLHLTSSSVKFDVEYLFAVCPNLSELRVIR